VERDEILRVLPALEEVQLEYVLIGAAAMAIHGVVRATEDLNLFIRATAENVERLKRACKVVEMPQQNSFLFMGATSFAEFSRQFEGGCSTSLEVAPGGRSASLDS